MVILQNPTILFRIYFYIYPILVFAHIPLQTFLDFNAVFVLIQVAKHPNPEAPGVPGSGRNWSLGAAAYLACWLAWIVVVCIVYELVYSFVRRWRTKRPPIFPIYTSSPARHLASLTSYSNFCFLYHIRISAFVPARGGSLRDGIAETLYFYSQNLPTVALLLPRAGLSLALLLAFWKPDPNVLALVNQGSRTGRDGTFFRLDGTLTAYARGVLAANAAWTVWRTLILLFSWFGLWILSGQICGGLCGPRYRWEEEDLQEKNRSSLYSLGDNNSDTAYYDPDSPLPWAWKERTRSRIWDAYEFCLAPGKMSGRWTPMDLQAYRQGYGEKREGAPSLPLPDPPGGFEGMDRLMAAVGLVPAPQNQNKRNILSEDFFSPEQPVASGSGIKPGRESPLPAGRATPPELAAVIPKVVQRVSKDKQPVRGGPLMELPYPFATKGAAQFSSEDVAETKTELRVPFPPSPSKKRRAVRSATSQDEEEGDEEEEEEDGDEDDGDDEEDAETGMVTSSEDPSSYPSSSSARGSNSMSSLGVPVTSRYPFQFRHPTTRSSGGSYMTSPSNGRSTINSRASENTPSSRSTRNRESTDSHSPRSHYTTSDAASPSSYAGLPLPPRRQGGQGRSRNIPSHSTPSSPSIDFPRAGGPRGRARGSRGGHSGPYGMSSPEPGVYGSDVDDQEDETFEFDESLMMEQPEPEGPQEAEEGEDVVGLLSSSRGPSPRASRTSLTRLRQRASDSFGSTRPRRLSLPSGSGSSNGSRSGPNSRANSHTSSSGGSRAGSVTGAVRSRTQSLLQTMGAASRSSLDLVSTTVMRTRANSSMARLEEDSDKTHSRSGSSSSAMGSSGGENNTFGHPIPRRPQWHQMEERVSEESEPPTPGVSRTLESEIPDVVEPASPSRAMREVSSELSGNAQSSPPSESEVTMHGTEVEQTIGGLAIPGRERNVEDPLSEHSSPADISTAAASFVTAPATIATSTDDSGRTISSWPDQSYMADRPDSTWRPA